MRIVATDDDHALAVFNRRHWLAMGVADEEISSEWLERTLAFITESRSKARFAGFLAFQNNEPIGSACCQLAAERYPEVLGNSPAVSGYVWGVFVEPEHRGLGIGQSLVNRCAQYLREQGCARVELHAGEQSSPLYLRMGFRSTDEMALRLIK